MALLEMAAEIEFYFNANWTDTPIQYPDRQFNYDGIDEYIELNFAPTQNDLAGFNGTSTGRIEYNGMSVVNCYHKTKKLALKLADDVGAFLNGQELPKNIKVQIPQYGIPIDLGNDFWMVQTTFEVRQC